MSIGLNHTTSNAKCIDDKLEFQDNGNCLVNSHNTLIDIKNIDDVDVTETFRITNTNPLQISYIHLWINHSCSNINVTDISGSLIFEKIVEADTYCYLKIFLRSEIQQDETATIYVSCTLNEIPYDEGVKSYFFEFCSSITYFTEVHYLIVRLPEESFIDEDSGLTAIYPTNQEQSFIGKRLTVSWSHSNLAPLSNPFYIIRFDPPDNPNAHIWAYILGPVLGVMIGVACTLWIMRRREKNAIQSMGTIFLNESQKILLKAIDESEGKIAQKDLMNKTGFTRSKTSRNLISLEQHEFVTKEKWGRNSLIKITKKGERMIK